MLESLRRRPARAAAALVATLTAGWVLYPAGSGSPESLLVSSTERNAAALGPPAGEPRAAEPAAANTAEEAPAVEGLRLHGVTASGAIIGFRNGGQRLILLGRNVLPGLRLEQVRQHHVLLASSGGLVELGFSGPARPPAPGADGRPAAAILSAEPEARRDEILRYRFGLAPRRSDGRITGFEIRRGADLPVLRRAGLQPGDVLIALNGQSFDSQEKVQELAGEIAGSFTAEFEFERGGRNMRRSLVVNPRN